MLSAGFICYIKMCRVVYALSSNVRPPVYCLCRPSHLLTAPKRVGIYSDMTAVQTFQIASHKPHRLAAAYILARFSRFKL